MVSGPLQGEDIYGPFIKATELLASTCFVDFNSTAPCACQLASCVHESQQDLAVFKFISGFTLLFIR